MPNGGTGDATLTANGVLLGEGTSAVTALSPSTTSGWVLTSNGGSSDPSWQAAPAATSLALSGLVAATTTNSIDNVNWAQTCGTGTASPIHAECADALIDLDDDRLGAQPAKFEHRRDLDPGRGGLDFGMPPPDRATASARSSMTATGNTGYAGYFASASTGAGVALYAMVTSAGNTGSAVYGVNSSVSGYGVYGLNEALTAAEHYQDRGCLWRGRRQYLAVAGLA